MEIPIWIWAGFITIIFALLAFDLGILHRERRAIPVGEAINLSAFYIIVALIFNAGVFWFLGQDKGLEFLTGYVIEKSLSLDNIFVIALIFGSLSVPPQYQHRVLFWGIIGALVMRGVMIWGGSALILEFRWIIYVFGAFLIATGLRMLFMSDTHMKVEDHWLVIFVRRWFPVTRGYIGDKFWVRRGHVVVITPLFLALIMVEFTDFVFAVDSIPAIFAITLDPFIVYTSNVFAILGLRALYFALAGIIKKFRYLKVGLALVLVLVGAKMTLVDIWKMPTALALFLTVGLICGSIVLSLIKGEAQEDGEARKQA